MHDIPAIAANPAEYGFEWVADPVRKKGMDLGHIPLVRITDIGVFDGHFPGVVLGLLQGSNSIRVGCQTIGRNMKWDDRGTTDDAIKHKQLSWLLGVRPETTAATYLGPDDERYTDREECAKAWMAHFREIDNA